jgi:hypothetical protein
LVANQAHHPKQTEQTFHVSVFFFTLVHTQKLPVPMQSVTFFLSLKQNMHQTEHIYNAMQSALWFY